MKNVEDKIAHIINTLPKLTHGQIFWIDKLIDSFSSPHSFSIKKSKIISKEVLNDFGYALLMHHTFSYEPFSKDKFEYVLAKVLESHGYHVELASKGNPGHDITIEEERISLKTQADKGIKNDRIWISKFMELGKGNWGDNQADLFDLVKQYLNHLNNYDRILSLRTLTKSPDWHYELVEIPKKLLQEAKSGQLEMKIKSKQFPKPGYCYVRGIDNQDKYQLYFDAGSERKLQIKNLLKKYCEVHSEWKFTIKS